MSLLTYFFLPAVSAILCACVDRPDEIIACGDDQVIIIDKKASRADDVKINWRWKVSDAEDLPSEYQELMVPTDDCKPVDGSRKILVTSSGGGAVLIDRETKKSLFYARVPNAHSAELLPGGLIAVALSTAEGGNSLELYDINKPEEVLYRDSLYSGHGVVWMDKTRLLFALGYDQLRSYSLQSSVSGKPELRLIERYFLPDNGGHDLSIVSENRLLLTTGKNVWIFDTNTGQFAPFEPLKDLVNVKSVNYNEKTGELVYTKGEISWWTHNIYFKNPDKVITITDINLYKVRTIPK